MEKSKFNLHIAKNNSEKGIWVYADYLANLESKFRLSLNEGDTKQVEYLTGVSLKREDENPTGSWKDRGMAFLISYLYSKGIKEAIIPSSGNAAISSSAYSKMAGISLYVCISPKTSKEKIEKIQNLGGRIIINERPISFCVRESKGKGYYNLRPSINEFASEGYKTIAYELFEQNGRIDDIFIPVSSGVGLLGIISGFLNLGFLPRIHACQPSSVCPIGKLFDKSYKNEESSPADSIVSKAPPLANKVIGSINESKGSAWVIDSADILKVQEELAAKGIITSAEGALSLASYYKAKKKREVGKAVCLLTGTKYL